MKYFGTDGIRGIAGTELSPHLAFNIGFAAAKLAKKNGARSHIVVGCDTRLSSDMLVMAVTSGVLFAGVDVIQVGIVPTPAVAFLTRKYSAVAGIMVTASHNPPIFNGIKIFNGDGSKASDTLQEEIENLMQKIEENGNYEFETKMGKAFIERHASLDYVEHLKEIISTDLSGMSVRLDVCNGAAFWVAPKIFEELGASVSVENANPDGELINLKSGATDPTRLAGAIARNKDCIGFAFDGDADRVIAVDEKGCVVDGDKILFALAKDMHERKVLHKNTVVGTKISSISLEKALKEIGVKLARVEIGDENIVREMFAENYSVGGEQCGHTIIKEFSNSGDGILTALLIARLVKQKNKKLSELVSPVKEFPFLKENFEMDKEKKERLSQSITFLRLVDRLGKTFPSCRIVARPSGTENKFRIDIQGTKKTEIETVMNQIRKFIKNF